MRVFLTGGTGLVGTRLVERLHGRGDEIVLLTRRPGDATARFGERCTVVEGDVTRAGPWMDRLAECDGVVHLAGAGIFDRRWSAAFKELIRTSRVDGTANVAAALCRVPRRADGTPKVLVSGSAIGHYGPHGDEELGEDAGPGADFLAGVCVEWERAAEPARACGARVVWLRTGIVLDPRGGALKQLLLPFKMFVGGPVGSGRQYMSWIQHDDEVGLILLALDDARVEGPLNATAPNPVTNREFSKALGAALGRPSFLPTPALGLRVALGQAAEIIATGQRVLPRKALGLGYEFKFRGIGEALRDLLA
jgi:uncharacterized protein (TIGR01777 family)